MESVIENVKAGSVMTVADPIQNMEDEARMAIVAMAALFPSLFLTTQPLSSFYPIKKPSVTFFFSGFND